MNQSSDEAGAEAVRDGRENGKQEKPGKKKPRLIRDTFSFPETDYALIAELKKRSLASGREAKKGEILRAGLIALAKLPDVDFIRALEQVEQLVPGRRSS